MKKIFPLLIFITLSITISIAQEQLTHLDETGNILSIDSKLNKKINIFTEYEHFEEAKLFQKQDETYVLEIFYKPNGKSSKIRKEMTRTEVGQLRSNVTTQIKLHAPSKEVNQEGRIFLLTVNTLVGIYPYAITLPQMFNTNSDKIALGSAMLIAGAGFTVPYFATKNSQVTKADAYLASYGQTRGLFHGILLSGATRNTTNPSATAGMILGMSIVEGVGGYYLSREYNYSTGTVGTMTAMGDFGFLLAPALTYVTGISDYQSNNHSTQIMIASSLLGSGLGLVSGRLMNKNDKYTQGDALVMRGAGFLGAYIPLATMIITDIKEPKIIVGSMLLGNAAGILMGDFLAKKNDLTEGQGWLVLLGEMAGSTIGFGLTYLATSRDNNYRAGFLAGGSAIGATAAFAYLTSHFSKTGSRKKENSKASIDFNINPTGFMGITNPESAKKLGPAPMFNLGITF